VSRLLKNVADHLLLSIFTLTTPPLSLRVIGNNYVEHEVLAALPREEKSIRTRGNQKHHEQ
jgi:hypothetical protein